MARFLIICVTAESGIIPMVINIEDLSKVDNEVKKVIESIFFDRPLLYAEVWRLLGDDMLTYHYSFVFDGVSLSKCRYFAPSPSSLKDHIEMFSFKSFEL